MNDTKQRQSHPELYVLLLLGIEPKILIQKGYSEATVYKYNRQLPEIKKRLNECIYLQSSSVDLSFEEAD